MLRGLAGFALAASVAACGPGRPATEVVVALTVPLSGSDAAAGAAFLRGCERAVAERNAAGGLRVKVDATLTVRLDARDDRSETPLAEQLVEQLWASGAALVLATPNDVRAVPQAVAAERLGRPLVVHPSNSPGLPSSHMRWVFALPRATPGDGVAPAPGESVLEARGHATLAAALAALDGVGTLDPLSVRTALQAAR